MVAAYEVAVLGLGNILLRDEGIGIRIIEELRQRYFFSPPIKIIDGGVLGFALINELEGSRHVIVVDAVKGGGAPGTIYRFEKEDIGCRLSQLLSAHDIGFIEVLAQWRMLGYEPGVVFLGIEPADMSSWDLAQSPCLQDKVPHLLKLVVEELEKVGVTISSQ